MKWPGGHLLGQATLDHIELSDLFLDRVVLVAQVIALVLQIALHVSDIIFTRVVGHSTARFDQSFDPAQLCSHHRDFLTKKVLFLLQRIILPLKLYNLVFLISSRHGHALTLTIVLILRGYTQVSILRRTCWRGILCNRCWTSTA